MLVLDGGGTSLKIWQITQAGKWQLVRRIRGNFNAHLFSAKQLAKTIATLPELQKTHSVLIGLAGLSDKSAQHALTHTLASTKALRGKALRVVSDWELQLERSFPNQDGIVVMLGTGSVFAARVGRRTVRIGGYGRWIGDAGSGWAIGIAALEKYLRLLDGFFVDEVFQNAMRKHFKSRESTLRKVYEENFPVQKLAEDIIKLAEQGSSTAETILQTEAQRVSEFVRHLKSITEPSLPVAVVGGLVEKPNAYRVMIETALSQ